MQQEDAVRTTSSHMTYAFIYWSKLQSLLHSPNLHEAYVDMARCWNGLSTREQELITSELSSHLELKDCYSIEDVYLLKFAVLRATKRRDRFNTTEIIKEIENDVNNSLKQRLILLFTMRRACEHFEDGDYLAAIRDNDTILQCDPNVGYCLSNRGLCRHELHQYNMAILDFDRAVQIKPYNEGLYYNRGRTYYSLSKLRECIADCTTELEMNPLQINLIYSTYIVRGMAYAIDNYEKAISDFTKAIELNHNSDEAYLHRGLCHFDKKDNVRAIQDFQTAFELNRSSAPALTGLAYCYQAERFYVKSLSMIYHAFQLNPIKYINYYKFTKKKVQNASEDKLFS
jgi:tetratricopeptide (TPR) repeat protein